VCCSIPSGKRSTTPEHRAVEGYQVNRWLYIEDNPADAELVNLVLREHCPEIQLHVVNNGDKALSFLRKQGANLDAVDPDLILMDLMSPANGRR
jgi:CheY-like chemotaxis protein